MMLYICLSPGFLNDVVYLPGRNWRVQGAAGIHSHFTLYFLSNLNYTKNQFKCMKFLGDVYLYI